MSNGELGCEQGAVVRIDDWGDRIDTPPATIWLPLLALLGGTCGKPVSIWLRDYPAHVVCDVHRFLLTYLWDEQVCAIVGQSDVSRLAQEGSPIVLGLIDPPRARSHVCEGALWSIARRRGGRIPALLIASESGLADSPGALLALRGSPDESRRVGQWLMKCGGPDPRIRSYFSRLPQPATTVDFAGLLALFDPTDGPAAWQPSPRTLETFQGLLSGHALLRAILASASRPHRVVPSLEDYRGIYALLQSPAVAVPEETGDPLLEAMVGRANLYMDHQANRGCSQAFKRGREGFASRVIRASNRAADRGRLISLRELADLGLARSPLLESLIDAVSKSGDPEKIRRMGLAREVSDERCLQGHSPEELRAILAWWSVKQVNSRFAKLRRQGFLEAVRYPSNGPLWLELPEELKGLPTEFQGLPSPERAEGLIAGSVPPA